MATNELFQSQVFKRNHACCMVCSSKQTEVYIRLEVKCQMCTYKSAVNSVNLLEYQDSSLLQEIKEILDGYIRDICCFYCKKSGKESKAVDFCATCERNMCNVCSENHRKHPMLEKHEVTSMVSGKQDQEECPRHNETVLYVCRACAPARLLCDVCLTCDAPCHDSKYFEDKTMATRMERESRIGLREDGEKDEDAKHTSEQSAEESQKQVVKREMSAKTTYQRSAKGPVSINECAADGKFICLENTGRREENLSGWGLKRMIDGQSRGDFTFPHGFSVPPGRKLKIWAKGQKTNPGPNDIEANQTSFGIGANITTMLVNQGGEDRATHIQRTIYSS